MIDSIPSYQLHLHIIRPDALVLKHRLFRWTLQKGFADA
jgi:hypothetical protein